jgi:hypothetical protein
VFRVEIIVATFQTEKSEMSITLHYGDEGFSITADDVRDVITLFNHATIGPQPVEVRLEQPEGPSPWSVPEGFPPPVELPWISHGGGECPYEEGELIDVRYRDGAIRFGVGALNTFAIIGGEPGTDRGTTEPFWRNHDSEFDIVAHRKHVA